MRAIDKGLTAGAHGLPLIGTGDWNDGMNRVGPAGRGESTWLGFFLHARAERLRAAVRRARRRRRARGALSRRGARGSRSTLEQAWDGEWYRRGYYDDGTPLGSAQNDECRIDSISQSWAVLSGAVPTALRRARDGRGAHARWSRADRRCCCCSTRRSTGRRRIPGYIKGYPPGVRENGGQYTHAAVWVVMALAELGSGDEAAELFHMLNPINHARTRGRRRRATRPSRT